MTAADISRVRGDYKAHLESELAKVGGASFTPSFPSLLEGQWKGMVWPRSEDAVHDPATGVSRDVLERVGRASVKVPEGYVSVLWFHVSRCGSC